MIRFFSQPLLLVILCITSSYAQIRLTSVDPVTKQVTIRNFGSSDVDISGYRLCSHLTYTVDLNSDANVSVVTGDLLLSQDESVTVQWSTSNGLDVDGRDLGLYLPGLPSVGFNDPAQMVDFMQYLGAYPVPNGRENVAVAKGIWDLGTFVNADGPYSYTGNATDMGSNFWEGTSPVCEISGLSLLNQTPCEPSTNTFTQEIEVTYMNEPSSGTLDVNGQSFVITGSPQTITLTGLIANGGTVDVIAAFSEEPGCTLTVDDMFTAPEECTICEISMLEAGFQTGCDPATNTYTQEITVYYENEPLTGSLDVNGQFFPITGSPQLVTFTGLVANGLEVNATARFTADTICNFTAPALFTSPEECFETCNIQAVLAGQQSNCNPSTNTYTQQIVVVYQFPPSSGTLDVNGQSFPIIGSPQAVVLSGLVANGMDVDVTVSFSDEPDCELTSVDLFTAPEDCTPNIPPVAVNDTVSVEPAIASTIDILANDFDEDGSIDPTTVMIQENPTNGFVASQSDGTAIYNPDPGFVGNDSFTYTVRDDQGEVSNIATVYITVEVLTALDPFEDPNAESVQFGLLANQVQVMVNETGLSHMTVDLIDMTGQLLHRAEYRSPSMREYVVPIPTSHMNQVLIVRAVTNKGSYSSRLVTSRKY